MLSDIWTPITHPRTRALPQREGQMTRPTHLEFDKPSLTIYGLAAQPLGIAVSPSLRFSHHANFPFPFRDQVRWRFNHIHLSGAEHPQ